MNWNAILFFKINSLVGKNRWLDAFGRAGAEFVIVAMLGWYMASSLIAARPQVAIVPIVLLALAVVFGWVFNVGIGLLIKEPRPHVTYPQSKLLFTPMNSWKSFPSDHAMIAWLIFFMAILFALPGLEMLLPLALWVSWGRV
ncbi:MAG TPA: phosphatase PAP2 family protein, partial [Patescibacteria group bacterium]|nr:phosphatase PAP2 family protein [Patescibacteria group bacterium]